MKLRYCSRNIFLAAADAVCMGSFLILAVWLNHIYCREVPVSSLLPLLFCPVLLVIVNNLSGLYGGHFFYPGIGVGKVEELKRLTLGIIGVYVILFAWLGATGMSVFIDPFYLAGALLLTLPAAPAARFLCRSLLSRFPGIRTRVLIAGAGELGRSIAQEVTTDNYYGFNVAGFLDDQPGENVCGSIGQAAEIAEAMNIDYLIVCTKPEQMIRHLAHFLENFRHVLIVPTDRILPIMWTDTFPIGCMASFEINNRLQMRVFRFSKMLAELFLAVCILPFVIPLCLFIAVLVKLSSPGPVFYRAERLGQNGRSILIWKFRTMRQDADAELETLLETQPEMRKQWENKFKLDNDPRVTPLGRFLRRTSLDELPQFWNVVRGDLAIIGPRPIVEEERKYYGENFKVFSIVKPGITGFWQVSGRSDTDYDRRVALDLYYIANWRLWMDYYIFLKTIVIVLTRQGAR